MLISLGFDFGQVYSCTDRSTGVLVARWVFSVAATHQYKAVQALVSTMKEQPSQPSGVI